MGSEMCIRDSITTYDPEFAAKMDVVEDVMRRRRNLLHELAK